MELDFSALEELRRLLEEIAKGQVASLRLYFDPGINGFKHKRDDSKTSPSIASTGTCVLSLLASGNWQVRDAPWSGQAPNLVAAVLKKEWTSAELPADNAFSVAWVLETVTAFEESGVDLGLNSGLRRKIERAERLLVGSLKDGCARIDDYPPSAYVTQLVVRVLQRRRKLRNPEKIRAWALTQITKQIALLLSESKTQDVYTLAYGTILFSSLSDPAKVTPEEKRIQDTAIQQLFKHQLPDGSWPRSRPLFHYPQAGNAYCYEYEMLAQLLQTSALAENLLGHMDALKTAALALKPSAFPLNSSLDLGWASGHHPQLQGPESWPTASVFHFAYALERLVSEAVRRFTFHYLDRVYKQPTTTKTLAKDFATKFLDCRITLPTAEVSLRDMLWEKLVKPISKAAEEVEKGRALPSEVNMSAILFGPPGTSKTQLASHIAEFLGWPLLVVDPSHLVRQGMDQIQKEANALFSMIEASERIVVFLDEFDEMVRDRAFPQSEAASRFLTTAMLPKLSRINDRRRVVFLLATNYIDNFDFAISRPGRFDLILQVMPPTADEKLRNWPDVKRTLAALKIRMTPKLKNRLEPLTYGEFKKLAKSLDGVGDAQDAIAMLDQAFDNCTLERQSSDAKAGAPETWRERSRAQQTYIRC